MASLKRVTDAARKEASDAVRQLRAPMALAGSPLPSLGVDLGSAVTGTVLVELGRARPDVVVTMAELIAEGLNTRAQQQN